MIQISIEDDFLSWRSAARILLQNEISPKEVLWTNNDQNSLFQTNLNELVNERQFNVPEAFLSIAEIAACYKDFDKWSVLYELLFRLIFENRDLLSIESDDVVRQVLMMKKAVGRDIHKFHAFVRFRLINFGEREVYVAWYEPHHFTVKLASPFFVRRFGGMLFSILTPKGCAHWDLQNLTFSEAVPSDLAPKHDQTEDFWLTYYKSIFNPFRLKIKAMKKEFPIRHWKTLPEAVLIPKLIQEANDKN